MEQLPSLLVIMCQARSVQLALVIFTPGIRADICLCKVACLVRCLMPGSMTLQHPYARLHLRVIIHMSSIDNQETCAGCVLGHPGWLPEGHLGQWHPEGSGHLRPAIIPIQGQLQGKPAGRGVQLHHLCAQEPGHACSCSQPHFGRPRPCHAAEGQLHAAPRSPGSPQHISPPCTANMQKLPSCFLPAVLAFTFTLR